MTDSQDKPVFEPETMEVKEPHLVDAGDIMELAQWALFCGNWCNN